MTEKSDENKRHSDQTVSRREMLQTLGKYSAIAALVLASPAVLLEGCGKDETVTAPTGGEPPPDGSTPEKAIPINFGDSKEATIRASDGTVKYYKFDSTQYYDVSLVEITAISLIGGSLAKCSILNSSLSEWASTEFEDVATLDFSLDSGTWYIKFEAIQGGGIITFNLRTGTPGGWDNYNDWNNYSDAWSNYSDSWSNYSDAWSNYSDSWSNYSDSWNNYSDYGAWGNWMQSW